MTELQNKINHRTAAILCQAHPDVNSIRTWACPDCLYEAKGELKQAQARAKRLEAVLTTLLEETEDMFGQMFADPDPREEAGISWRGRMYLSVKDAIATAKAALAEGETSD